MFLVFATRVKKMCSGRQATKYSQEIWFKVNVIPKKRAGGDRLLNYSLLCDHVLLLFITYDQDVSACAKRDAVFVRGEDNARRIIRFGLCGCESYKL